MSRHLLQTLLFLLTSNVSLPNLIPDFITLSLIMLCNQKYKDGKLVSAPKDKVPCQGFCYCNLCSLWPHMFLLKLATPKWLTSAKLEAFISHLCDGKHLCQEATVNIFTHQDKVEQRGTLIFYRAATAGGESALSRKDKWDL